MIVGDVLQRRDVQFGPANRRIKVGAVFGEMVHLQIGRNLGAKRNCLCLESCVAWFCAVGQHDALAAHVALAPGGRTSVFEIIPRRQHCRADLGIRLISEQQWHGELSLVALEVFRDEMKLKIFAEHSWPEERLQLRRTQNNDVAVCRIVQIGRDQSGDAHASERHLTVVGKSRWRL